MNVFIFSGDKVVTCVNASSFNEFVDLVLKMKLEPGNFTATVTTLGQREELNFQITEETSFLPQTIVLNGLRPKLLKLT